MNIDDDDDDEPTTSARRYPMKIEKLKKLLERLFADAPKLTDANGNPVPGQAPALTCHVLFLHGGAVEGVLSTTPEDMLRLLSAAKDERNQPIMVEQFFDYSDVMAIAIRRDVSVASGSRIIS